MNRHEMVCYETDASRMIGVVEKVLFPKSIEEVQKIVKTTKADIVPRGAGTGLVGGCIPDNSIVVDMGKMNKVTNFISSRKTVRVEAGITLKELNEKLYPLGFEFPIDDSKRGISTLGGMIARNATGDRSMRYGNMRDWIEEIEFVNGKGELIKTSKADLTDVCGMEGITGIIIAATLKLAPLIKRSASIFQSENIDEVLSIARRLKSEREVVMLELLSPYISKILDMPDKYNLIIEFNSERGKIKGKDYEELSRTREDIFSKIASEGYYNMEDPKLFFDKIKEFILLLEENNIPYVGHLGFGVIVPFFKDYEKEKREQVIEFIKRTKAIPGKFGIGLTRKYFVDGFQVKLIQRVKLRHDPKYRFNKGKIIGMQSNHLHESVRVVDDDIIEKSIEDVEERDTKREKAKEITGEELSAVEVIREVSESDKLSSLSFDNEGQDKTPEEKFDDFIKEIELKEKVNLSLSSDDNKGQGNINEGEKIDIIQKEESVTQKKEEIKIDENQSSELSFQEVQEKLKDYEDTFSSELNQEKVQEVENIVKNIPREITRNEIEFRPREKAKTDYNQINDIMTNNINKPDGDKPGKVTISDNLDKKSELSAEDRELINKILGNRYKRDNMEDKK